MRLLTISFIISFLGILLLLILSVYAPLKQINSEKELKLNEQVKTTGKIISVRTYDDFNIIKLDNNITITCNCKFPVNETIIAEGKVEEYQGKLQVNAERIQRTG